MFTEIIDEESYWGKVISVDDPKRAARIKVQVYSIFDEIPTENLPWAMPRYLDGSVHDLPAIGDSVQIKFLNNDIYFPTWYRIRQKSDKLSDADYPSASVIVEKDLEKYDLDGQLSIRYTQSEGLMMELIRDGNLSTIIIRNDNSIILKNGQTGRFIHISNESISIGSETKSQQPCVVGDDNHEALDMLNNTVHRLSEIMEKNLKILAKIAKTNPYTMLLSLPLEKYSKEVQLELDKLHKENKKFFPETLSTIATIDKT